MGIMPGSAPIHFKLVFEVPTGRILGAQAIGNGLVGEVFVIADAQEGTGDVVQVVEAPALEGHDGVVVLKTS